MAKAKLAAEKKLNIYQDAYAATKKQPSVYDPLLHEKRAYKQPQKNAPVMQPVSGKSEIHHGNILKQSAPAAGKSGRLLFTLKTYNALSAYIVNE